MNPTTGIYEKGDAVTYRGVAARIVWVYPGTYPGDPATGDRITIEVLQGGKGLERGWRVDLETWELDRKGPRR